MATVDAGVKLFPASGGGHIVAVSSVAAYRGLPGHASYSASKAGLNVYLEAVRAEVQDANIVVTTLAPGYIDTPLNQHMKSRPFLVTVEDGAKRAADLIERGVRVSAVPVFPWNAIGFVMRNLPDFVWYRVMRSQAPPPEHGRRRRLAAARPRRRELKRLRCALEHSSRARATEPALEGHRVDDLPAGQRLVRDLVGQQPARCGQPREERCRRCRSGACSGRARVRQPSTTAPASMSSPAPCSRSADAPPEGPRCRRGGRVRRRC
jgi:hypothetical protein